MTWTTEKPTKPGWYWYRGHYDVDRYAMERQPVVILVEQEKDQLVAWQPFRNLCATLDHFPGEWAGPISGPHTAGDQELYGVYNRQIAKWLTLANGGIFWAPSRALALLQLSESIGSMSDLAGDWEVRPFRDI